MQTECSCLFQLTLNVWLTVNIFWMLTNRRLVLIINADKSSHTWKLSNFMLYQNVHLLLLLVEASCLMKHAGFPLCSSSLSSCVRAHWASLHSRSSCSLMEGLSPSLTGEETTNLCSLSAAGVGGGSREWEQQRALDELPRKLIHKFK